ncbi:hypothetical protein KRMM14A1259_69320 [Krasilnikovia sp. MM14-A1259]
MVRGSPGGGSSFSANRPALMPGSNQPATDSRNINFGHGGGRIDGEPGCTDATRSGAEVGTAVVDAE